MSNFGINAGLETTASSTGIGARSKALALSIAAPVAMWAFGLVTGALCLNAAWTSMNSPSEAVSVFGADSNGAAFTCSGLTFGGPTQTWFSGVWGLDGLAGMEGALMATGLGFLVLMALMISVLPTRGSRIAGPALVMGWTLLWAGNSIVVGVRHAEMVMFPLALLCLGATVAAAVMLRQGLRFHP